MNKKKTNNTTHPFSAFLTPQEEKIFKKLNTPSKIQDYLNELAINFEEEGETVQSPRTVLKTNKAHCLEGALFAAAVLWYHGEKPLLLDLKASAHDYDHVVALFQMGTRWGAISKTNHAVLRYREPIYKSIRELAVSYFHEYFNDKGIKTLRSFSRPFSLKRYGTAWITSTENLWDIGGALDDAFHEPITTALQHRRFRKADPLEIEAGKLVQYTTKKKTKKSSSVV